ncbi:hypothetical protein [Tenacibaculum sp. 190524A05c]|uniref:hypothetical protein n=1 Tax=Tenacibaculum platacis TaxID=3137852 RepID=UPI0031FA4D0D
MKRSILTIMAIGLAMVTNAQWTNSGDNTTTGKVTLKEVKFPLVNFDFSKMPRTQIDPMSIKLFDDYYTFRPGGSSPDNNAYGTLLAINGRTSHWENNIYFGAVTHKMYFRISKYTQHTAENGVKGDYNEWRTLLDNKSDVKTSKLLKIEGNGAHYILKGKFGVGTTLPKGKFEVYAENENKEIYFKAQHDGRNQNSDSPRLNFVGKSQTAGFGIQAMNSGGYGKKDLVFYAHNASDYTSYYEAARLTYDGKLGLGTNAPKAKLQLYDQHDASRTSVKDLLYLSTGNSSVGYDGFGTGIVDFRRTYQNSTPHAINRISFIERGHSTSDKGGAITFATKTLSSGNAAPVERMRVDYNGIVGIGTTQPGAGISPMHDLKLHVDGSITVNSGKRIAVDQNYYSHGYIQYNSSVSKARFLRYGYYGHRFDDNGGTRMVIQQGGNVGIGTTVPSTNLHVRGSSGILLTTDDVTQDLKLFRDGEDAVIEGRVNNNLILRTKGNDANSEGLLVQNAAKDNLMFVNGLGKVGIGVTDTKGYNLAVAGSNGIVAEKVTVKLRATWPDYVFTNDYKLPTLEEVEQQISNNGHLSNIPSAAEVKKNGIELGEMNKKLLEKIEELTLYTIQQDKEIKALKKQDSKLEKLEKENQELKDRLSKIEKMLSKK